MKLDLVLLYAFIVGIGCLKYLLCRYFLSRGLSEFFNGFRRGGNLEPFFVQHKMQYLAVMFWMALAYMVVCFSAFRLLYLVDLMHLETVIILTALCLMCLKDLVIYTTADFVAKRVSP